MYFLVVPVAIVVTAELIRGRRPRRRTFAELAVAGILILAVLAPVAVAYLQTHGEQGFGRSRANMVRSSADVISYFQIHPRLSIWGDVLEHGRAEGELFPGFLLIGLATAGLAAGLAPAQNCSPRSGRQGAAKTHDGRVITQAPNVMWGTDGVRVFTLDDGWGWIFAAVEHWNAECVGWHVCKVGSRFAALDPIAQGLERLYGSLDADVARGLALRMDHGSQYLSDHFLKQIRYWGIHPSFGFVEEPETNGVAERWNRTLKEQAIHGRIFQNLEAVRAAVADFVVRYNQTWRLEKLGYQTPIEAREEYELRQAA